jgi:hypothetical protein
MEELYGLYRSISGSKIYLVGLTLRRVELRVSDS